MLFVEYSINYDVNGLLDFKNKTNKSIKINFDSWIKEELRLGFLILLFEK